MYLNPCFDDKKKNVYTFHLSRIKATLRLATHVFLYYTLL